MVSPCVRTIDPQEGWDGCIEPWDDATGAVMALSVGVLTRPRRRAFCDLTNLSDDWAFSIVNQGVSMTKEKMSPLRAGDDGRHAHSTGGRQKPRRSTSSHQVFCEAPKTIT